MAGPGPRGSGDYTDDYARPYWQGNWEEYTTPRGFPGADPPYWGATSPITYGAPQTSIYSETIPSWEYFIPQAQADAKKRWEDAIAQGTSQGEATPYQSQSSNTNPYMQSTTSTVPYDVNAALQNSLQNILGTTGSSNTSQYGFPQTDRDKYNKPIIYSGQLIQPPSMEGSTTDATTWQAALDSIFGPQKTGWNTGTNW